MSKALSETYLKLIDSNLESDFLLFALQYELVTGNRFQFRYDNEAIYSMVQHALMSEDRELVRLSVRLLNILPVYLSREFNKRGITTLGSGKRSSGHTKESSAIARDKSSTNKFWRLLHLKNAG